MGPKLKSKSIHQGKAGKAIAQINRQRDARFAARLLPGRTRTTPVSIACVRLRASPTGKEMSRRSAVAQAFRKGFADISNSDDRDCFRAPKSNIGAGNGVH
jgi:hypothetical protein